MKLPSEWAACTVEGPGVVVMADTKVEWMLPWWWENYAKHNTYPFLFVDIGMSNSAKKFCAKLSEYNQTVEAHGYGWFAKPAAILQSPFRQTVFTDVDVEIRGDLRPLFDLCADGIAVRPDTHDNFTEYPNPVNSGVVCVQHGHPVIPAWYNELVTNQASHWSDQSALTKELMNTSYTPLTVEHHRLRFEGDGVTLAMHWTGPVGKQHIATIIRQRMAKSPGERDGKVD